MFMCIGEIIVNIYYDEGKEVMIPGGSPFNIAYSLASFGEEVAFAGIIGADKAGYFLSEYIVNKTKIKYPLIALALNGSTTTTNVEVDEEGKHDINLSSLNSINGNFNVTTIKSYIQSCSMIHFGSLCLAHEDGMKNLLTLIKYIKKRSSSLLSFDARYREVIYKDIKDKNLIISKYVSVMKEVNIIKMSEEDVLFFGRGSDLKQSVKNITNSEQLVFITLGKRGSIAFYKDYEVYVNTIPVKPIDMMGAGDAFLSVCLKELKKTGLAGLNEKILKKILKEANNYAKKVIKIKGAIL